MLVLFSCCVVRWYQLCKIILYCTFCRFHILRVFIQTKFVILNHRQFWKNCICLENCGISIIHLKCLTHINNEIGLTRDFWSSVFLFFYMLYATNGFYISQVETFCKLYLSMIRSTTNQQKFFLSDHRMYAKILTTWMNCLFICKIMRNVR